MPRKQRSRKDRKKNNNKQQQQQQQNNESKKEPEREPSEKESENRGNEATQPENIQPIVDEPLPEIPSALTGSLVEGQSQIDLLNALEEDVPLAQTSDHTLAVTQDKLEFESEIDKEESPPQETIITIPEARVGPLTKVSLVTKGRKSDPSPEVQDEIPPEASVVVEEPKSESKQEKEEFEARSLEVFQKLFKSPVKCNFPLPNSALNASVFEASNPPLPAISLSHENYFDSRPILSKSANEAEAPDAIVPISSKRNLFLDEFDANLSDSHSLPENDANSNAMFESMPDLEQESEDDGDENRAIEEGISALSIEAAVEEVLDSDDEQSSERISRRLDQNHPLLTFECEFNPMDSESDSEEIQIQNEEEYPHIEEHQLWKGDHVHQEEHQCQQSDEFDQLREEPIGNKQFVDSNSISDEDQFIEEKPAPIAAFSPSPEPNLIDFPVPKEEEEEDLFSPPRSVSPPIIQTIPTQAAINTNLLAQDEISFKNDFDYESIISSFKNNGAENALMGSASMHNSSIIRHLGNMQKRGEGVDLALESTTGERIWVHRFILESFCADSSLSTFGRIAKCPFDNFTISIAVEFLYKNRLFLTLENADMYLSISEFFGGIECLEMTILEFLCQSISDENYADIMQIAEKYNKSNLQDLILNKICENVSDYQNEILKLSPESFIELIRRDELSVKSEEDVVELVKKWTKEDVKNRTLWLPKILDHVRFSCLQPNFIVTQIASDAIFSGPCSASIMQAMSYHLLGNAKFENDLAKMYPRNSSKNICVVGYTRDNTQISGLKNSQWINFDSSCIPPSLTSFQTVTVEGFIFIIGGEVQNSSTGAKVSSKSVYIYDPRLEEIRETTPMSYGRTHFSAVYVSSGKIFVFGGRNSETGILRENEVYDIKSAKWTSIRPLEHGRCSHDASVVGANVVLTGGYVQERNGRTKYTSSVIMFDTICGLWKQIGDLTTPRGWHKSIVYQDEIYVFGGYYQNATQRITVAPVERISLTGSTQTIDLDLIINSSPGIALDGNQVYITGGWDEKWRRFSQICFKVDLDTFTVEKLEMRLQNSVNFHQTTFVQF
ncbi:Oidioi.mRNA.OKI2018_I69.PAR.g9095.t1.cds [Oikopleura dioica]|uniref:Oidioi.mRNA.OKI2018_I69.PAR.g9095.t1.cds n=1 Tax=Oikopleura dioica TaxID=34765 RepID=A0ABN7RLL0_OIKDI|nr:Oidioi.mRNA.OKI2018_I69.PAR.g9095.t1.cds [Oikopleura dioica]